MFQVFRASQESSALRASIRAGHAGRVALVVGALAGLAGCSVDRPIVRAEVPDDYRARHPIVVAEGTQAIEILASGPTLDKTSRDRVIGLARDAREYGRGGIEILFPRGGVNDSAARAALPAIRAALGAGGIGGYASVGSYPVADPSTVAPVRIAYRALRARVAGRCGEWPSDLSGGASTESWRNRPYWNHGCAYQTMIAAQVSDPSDLVEPRATSNGDVEMRIRAIGKVRQGSDPGTTWVTKNSSIGSVGAN